MTDREAPLLTFHPALPTDRPARLLFLGAHSDDIELGCGGTILRWLSEHHGAQVTWIVFSAEGARADEARRSAVAFLASAGSRNVRTLSFRDSYFPYQGAEVKECVESLKPIDPDIIFTHHRHDLHQDHRLLCELTWNAFRHHLILEYEIAKYDGDLASPQVFVPIDESHAARKCELIRAHFATQRSKHWFDEHVFMGLMRLRGMECRSPTGFAEAFHARKIVL